jgi:phage shock protein PspC (stress-responsive transcriptional regulator)
MQKTFNINLYGQIFHINEDAFQLLSDYLKSLKNLYQKEEGGDEIMADIEARISEIFLKENNNEAMRIITIDQVERVIQKLGKVEEHYDVSEEESSYKKTYSDSDQQQNKKLFRDPDHSIVAGVCSGLSQYLGINDSIWIRLLFVISIFAGFGSGIIAYIVLWILMPQAMTASEKLQMRGEPINLENIEKTIKSGINNVSNTLNNLDNKEGIKNASRNAGDIIMSIFKALLRLTKVFLLIITLIIAISFVIGLFATGFSALATAPITTSILFESKILGYITIAAMIILMLVSSIFLILLPFHLFSKSKKPLRKPTGITIAILWIGAFIITLLGSFDTIRQFASTNKVLKEETIAAQQLSDTIYISTNINPEINENDINLSGVNVNLLWNNWNFNGDNIFSNTVKLNIAQSPDQDIHIFEERTSKGANTTSALKNARNILYNYKRSGDTLVFDEYITNQNKNAKYRLQNNEITLYIPEGKVIVFDNADQIIHKKPMIKNYDSDNYFSMGSTPWKLENGTLIPLNENAMKDYTAGWKDITPTTNFNDIEINGFVETEIIYAETRKIITDSPEYLDVNAIGNKISVDMKGKNFRANNIPNFKIKIYTPELVQVETDGLTKTIVSGFQQNMMKVDISGNSSLSLNNNTIDQLEAQIEGLSSLDGFSTIKEASLKVEGMSHVKGKNLMIQSLKIKVDGASNAEVNVAKNIKGNLNGTSTLIYSGQPLLDVKTSGNSEVSAIQ